jgi:high-affinity iron transporter
VHEAFLSNYLIGLREGLEATLVVSILIAFLVKSGRRERLAQVWLGVGVAVALSVGLGAVLSFVAADLLSDRQRDLFVGVSSIVAVGFVTWMIFWMRRFAHSLASDLRGRMEQAARLGPLAVAVTAFFAVAREGLETALLFYTAAQNASRTTAPLVGLLLGLACAVGLGTLMVVGGLRINLGRFFLGTGVLLILVAAGIARYAVHDLTDAGVMPWAHAVAFDVSRFYDEGAWYAAVLGGMFNLSSAPTVLEVVVWVGYAVPVLAVFLRRVRPGVVKRSPPVTAGVRSG